MKLVILTALTLAACDQAAEAPAASKRPAAAPQAPEAPPKAKAASFDLKDDLIDFHFGWSAEVAAIPELVRKLTADKDNILDKLKEGAAEARRERIRERLGLSAVGFQSSTQYDTAGRSPRLLSLSVATSAYTGGAHGNYGMSALLWDRLAKREINFASLFVEPANRDRLLTARWCDALNQAREEKRGKPVGGGMFDDCPGLDQIAIVPADADGNGRLELLKLVASPYVAGSFAEGVYEVKLAVTPDLMAALKSDFRDSFEAAQPQ